MALQRTDKLGTAGHEREREMEQEVEHRVHDHHQIKDGKGAGHREDE